MMSSFPWLPPLIYIFFFYCYGDHRDLHSFPTRRSSDLRLALYCRTGAVVFEVHDQAVLAARQGQQRSLGRRSEEHTSELQSRPHLVCRLLLEKKNTAHTIPSASHFSSCLVIHLGSPCSS